MPNGLAFADRNGTPLINDDDDDSDDESWHPDDADDSSDSDDENSDDDNNNNNNNVDSDADEDPVPNENPIPIAGVNDVTNDAEVQDVEVQDEPESENEPESEDEPESEVDDVDDDVEDEETPGEANENTPEADSEIGSQNIIDPQGYRPSEQEQAIIREMTEKYGARPPNNKYGLRTRRPRDYGHANATLEAITMTQYSMKKGIKVFGEPGVTAVLDELKQLHDRKVLEPKSGANLTREDKKCALNYLMFLKKKRCGRIKGRGCADGRKQRATTTKEEASSPTVAIESVMLTSVIDAKENRDVAIVDIPGAFMQADMDELVHMKLEGKMAELLVRLDPKLYRKYIQVEKGRNVLYVELKKALYGTLRAALLFWRLLTAKLKEWGFEINPYDWCVANKMINGKQCTIVWHVDDLKISHVDSKAVTGVIDQLQAAFGTETPITVKRGKIHDYLGMTLDFSSPGKVRVTMIDYIKNMLADLPSDMDGIAATAAPSHLFEVNMNDPIMFDEDNATLCHHNVAKLLFLCKRARPDIQTAVSFLCTRVKGPDNDDYKKLTRLVKYLRDTLEMPLTLEADKLNILKWWVDASYAVHPDMKSHTGAVLTLGKGAVHAASRKQKLNVISSTESELVGVSDMMPQIIWTQYFMNAQGYDIDENIVHQDNQSSMLMENNGRASSSKRTRHINIRYFFVTDRIQNGEMSVKYCPTGIMLADYFTKALQGTPFKTFRDLIMNCDP